ncbi:MAG: DUF362 domain-containing protein [Verrucomicrobiales bacterium]|jgi:hypothetical protein|nr:DUF362 domain-containing protein [Verrucomicrobiales bacterium]
MRYLPALLFFSLATVSGWGADGGTKSRVVVLENPAVIDNFQVNDARLAEQFNRALLAFTRQSTVSAAWRQFVTPRDIVAIHVTTGGGQILSSHHALVDAVVNGLRAAGVASRNIIVWDKFADDLQAAGYSPGGNPFRCESVISGMGFDGGKFYFSDLAGQLIWGDHDFRGKSTASDNLFSPTSPDTLAAETTGSAGLTVSGSGKNTEPPQVSNRSYYARLITRRATKIINLPVMSNDERIGLAGCVASLAFAGIDNTRRFLNPSDAAAEAIAEIYANDAIGKKVALNIMDGTIAQYAGGPYFVPYYCAQPGLLYLSQDPVAIDTLALERIEAWRKLRAIDPVGKDARHLRQAVALGLGTDDRSRMEIINLR